MTDRWLEEKIRKREEELLSRFKNFSIEDVAKEVHAELRQQEFSGSYDLPLNRVEREALIRVWEMKMNHVRDSITRDYAKELKQKKPTLEEARNMESKLTTQIVNLDMKLGKHYEIEGASMHGRKPPISLGKGFTITGLPRTSARLSVMGDLGQKYIGIEGRLNAVLDYLGKIERPRASPAGIALSMRRRRKH